jgi:molybdopterin biosynthesis enzyme
MIARAALADALVLIRRGGNRLQRGESVEFLRLG